MDFVQTVPALYYSLIIRHDDGVTRQAGAYAAIQTVERALYACIILKKGVIRS